MRTAVVPTEKSNQIALSPGFLTLQTTPSRATFTDSKEPGAMDQRRVVQKSFQAAQRLSSKCYSTKKLATPEEMAGSRIPPSSFRSPVRPKQLIMGVKEELSVYPGGSLPSLLSQKDFFLTEFEHSDLLVKQPGSDRWIARLASHIRNKKTGAAWRLYKELAESDPQVLARLPRSLVSKFMSIFVVSAVYAARSMKQLEYLAQSMKSAGLQLRAEDYTILISCAFKSHNYDLVEKYWVDAESSGITKTTTLYNSYMQAACNAYPKFWNIWRFNRDSPRKRFLPGLSNNVSTPYAHIDAITILQLMHRDEVPTNARTYELALLYYAQIGEPDKLRSIMREIWKVEPFNEEASASSLPEGRPLKGDLLYPTISTLRSVVTAFSFNDRVTEGIYYMTMLQRNYNISLENDLGTGLFSELLKWVFYTTEPNRGSTPAEIFHKIWDLATVGYQISPSIEMYYWWVRRMLSDVQYDRTVAVLPLIAEMELPGRRHINLVAQIVSRVARSYSLEGELEKSTALLQSWLHLGPELEEVKERVEAWMEVNKVVAATIRERERLKKRLESETLRVDDLDENELHDSQPEHHINGHANTSAA